MSTAMYEQFATRLPMDNESEAARLEQRWFAACKQAELMRRECEILREVMEVAQANWRDAVGKLTDMEALRDQLEARCATHSMRDPIAWLESDAALPC